MIDCFIKELKLFIILVWTMMGMICAGIVNMIFCKSKVLSHLNIPIDFNKKIFDNKHIFGSHKTIRGFIGYVVFAIIFQLLIGLINKVFYLEKYNLFYEKNSNTLVFNLMIGSLLGLAYALFELPNSFLKRRFNIIEGENAKGCLSLITIFFDQADSMFGIWLVATIFCDIDFLHYVKYVLYSVIFHILLNRIIYNLKLRDTKY